MALIAAGNTVPSLWAFLSQLERTRTAAQTVNNEYTDRLEQSLRTLAQQALVQLRERVDALSSVPWAERITAVAEAHASHVCVAAKLRAALQQAARAPQLHTAIRQAQLGLVQARAAHRTARTEMENAEEAGFDVSELEQQVAVKKQAIDSAQAHLRTQQEALGGVALLAEYFPELVAGPVASAQSPLSASMSAIAKMSASATAMVR